MAQISAYQPGQAFLAGTFEEYVEVYISVQGAATFFVGTDRQSLEQSGIFQSGLAFTQANTSPPFKLTWIGPLWILANAGGSVIEVTPTIRPGGKAIA